MKRLAVSFKRDREAWEIHGEVYLGPINTDFGADGYPMGTRWECSIAHWNYYRNTVFSDFADIVEVETKEA